MPTFMIYRTLFSFNAHQISLLHLSLLSCLELLLELSALNSLFITSYSRHSDLISIRLKTRSALSLTLHRPQT